MGNGGLDIDLVEINDMEDGFKKLYAKLDELISLQQPGTRRFSELTGVSPEDFFKFENFTVDLSEEHDYKTITKEGSLILVNHLDGEAYLHKDKNGSGGGIPLHHVRKIPVPETFKKFYISNPAQKDGLVLKGAVTSLDILNVTGIPTKVDPVHRDRPWGDFQYISDSSVTVPAGDTIELASRSGFGWILYLLMKSDYKDLKLVLSRDGQQAYPKLSVTDLADTYGLDKANNIPRMTAYDDTDSEYVMALDPPDPWHFDESFTVEVENPDTVDHNVTDFDTGIVI